MKIGNFNIEIFIDQLLKKAEAIANNNMVVSKIIDAAFESIGKTTGRMVEFQNQSYAMMRMLKAWYAKEYTGLSPKAVASLLASGIYLVNPLDFIPDFIPVIGRIDDKLVLGYFIKKMNNEIQKFMAWEESQEL